MFYSSRHLFETVNTTGLGVFVQTDIVHEWKCVAYELK